MKTIETLKEEYKELGKEGYTLDINPEALTAIASRISKRSKLGSKTVFAYRFESIERLIEYVTEYKDNILESEERKILRKQQQKELREKELKEVKVNDIFCYSWGYEQTNVSFYQVIERKGKSSAIVRPISCESVEECSWASDYVKPCANVFIGEEETVRLSGKYFKRSFGCASLTSKDEKHYRSWYA